MVKALPSAPPGGPGHRSSLRVGGPEGVQGGVTVLRLAEGSPAGGGDGGHLVDAGHRHHLDLLQGASVPAIRGPDGHLVDVVPVGVGGPLVVRRVAEPELAQCVDHEVPAVPARGAPPGDLHAGPLRVRGRVGGQHPGHPLVLRHAARGTAEEVAVPGNHRPLVDLGHHHEHRQAGGVGLRVRRLDGREVENCSHPGPQGSRSRGDSLPRRRTVPAGRW